MSRPVLLAFVAFVLLAGSNAAAVKAVLGEMPPFWSAGLRFVLAGALLLGLMIIQRRPAPRGQQLLGTVLYRGHRVRPPLLLPVPGDPETQARARR